MPYTKQHNPWVQNITVIDAADMDGIENGIVTAQSTAETAQSTATTAQSTATSAQGTANAAQTTANGAVQKLNDLSDVSNPTAALGNLNGVPKTRTVSAGTGLTGGGDLTANRTLSVVADAGLPTQTGNSGKFLTTNGTVSSWGTVASSNPTAPRVPKISSLMGPSAVLSSGASSAAWGSGAVPMSYIEIGSQITIDQLGLRVMTLEAAMNAKVLLYSSDADGYPATLVKDSGPLSCAATGDVISSAFTGVVLTPGVYWAAIRSNAGSAVRFMACQQIPKSTISTGTTNLWQAVNYLTADPGTYASPANITAWGDSNGTGSVNLTPLIYMRRSA